MVAPVAPHTPRRRATCVRPAPARPHARARAQAQGSLLAAPGGLDPSSSKARGAPVPEKAWAARNVARSLLGGGGAGGAREAARMLREAAEDCAGYYGAAHPGAPRQGRGPGGRTRPRRPFDARSRHAAAPLHASHHTHTSHTSHTHHKHLTPAGQLSTLLDLIDALLALYSFEPEEALRGEAAGAIRRALEVVEVRARAARPSRRAAACPLRLKAWRSRRCPPTSTKTQQRARAQSVGARYRAQGDLLSLVLLYEAAQAELDYPQVGPTFGRGWV